MASLLCTALALTSREVSKGKPREEPKTLPNVKHL